MTSECFGPPGAPISAIYLHGLFNPSGEGWYASIEKTNRQRLKLLAEKLHIRIALPLSPIGQNLRFWHIHGSDGSMIENIEQQAQKACQGAALASPRSLIGFSNGGYMTRHLAQGCNGKNSRLSAYQSILMIGTPAHTRVKSKDETRYANCPQFTTMMGTQDKTIGTVESAQTMIDAYKSQGGKGSVMKYRGNHDLPSAATLANVLKGLDRSSTDPNTETVDSVP